jgi:S-adenosylmethionine synthetase
LEVIERKGAGHPDTLADMLGEELGKELKKAYLKEYGRVMHYNVDKVLVACGKVDYELMEIIEPIRIVFAGNYTALKKTMVLDLMSKVEERVLAPEHSNGFMVTIDNYLSECSADLTNNFNRHKCNDTSFAVGFPLTEAEQKVLKLGQYLDNLYKKHKNIGRDNKIMYIDGTYYIALAFKQPITLEAYKAAKEKQKETIAKTFKIPLNKIHINTADTEETQFITLTGTSLEQGDAGMTGRGNRRNGLITPMKPMTLEAYYGKNDITHIGRIYQDKAQRIANREKKKVLLVNHIGGNINKPIKKYIK